MTTATSSSAQGPNSENSTGENEAGQNPPGQNSAAQNSAAQAAPAQTAQKKQRGGLRIGIQKVGSFMSSMIMPIIPALIAWGLLTALVVNVAEFYGAWGPTEALDSATGPMIHYLLPVLIAVQGGKMVYDMRGAVVGATATLGAIAGSDYLLGEQGVHMFIGAMIMGPLAAWVMKKLDGLWEGRIKPGFEMLVNMFSAGILAFLAVIAAFFGLAPVVNWLMDILGRAVASLVETGLLPLTSVLIEPAKVFFLNNAINHGVLTPLGVTESSGEAGQSILFLLEVNPGPGLGVLLAFSIFGIGAARATAPGAAIIVFFGGIHEVYFPYVLMKPALVLAVIGGGASGVATNMLFDTGLVSAAAPGSIIAILLLTAQGSYLGVILSVIIATAVSFAIASLILLSSRKKDAEGDEKFNEAVARTAANKGTSSQHLDSLSASGDSVGSGAGAGAAGTGATGAGAANSTAGYNGEVPDDAQEPIRRIYFACDAGMGSSAMGASVLRKKIHASGVEDILVTNKAISSLPGDADLVVTQQALTDRARGQEPAAIHVSVGSFMDAPEYDDVVQLVRSSRETPTNTGELDSTPEQAATAEASGDAAGQPVSEPAEDDTGDVAGTTATTEQAASGVLTQDRVRIHSGAATQDEALIEAHSILKAAGAVTDEYLDAMREREATVSTFMGNGLAIPHGTNEAKAAIHSSALAVVRYDGGANWNGDEATFVIGIAGVGDEHMEILSKIAQLFADEDQVATLQNAASEQELYELLNAVNEEA